MLELVENSALLGLTDLKEGLYSQIRLILDSDNRLISREGAELIEHSLVYQRQK